MQNQPHNASIVKHKACGGKKVFAVKSALSRDMRIDVYKRQDLDKIEPMIALPFHPSNAYTIREFKRNAKELLVDLENAANEQYASSGIKSKLTDKLINGEFYVDQGIIAGCAGGIFENIMAAADILRGGNTGSGEFAPVSYTHLDVYKRQVPDPGSYHFGL